MKGDFSNSVCVAEFYESIENKLWAVLARNQVHLGFWDQSNRDASFADGVQLLTDEMVSMVNIQAGQRFVDIGCGLGVPAMQLASATNCLVDGVTISPYQCHEAQLAARELGMQEQVSFYEADALKMPFEDGSFDGGWFFESIFHMGHGPALKEAHRVLKPGASLIIADLVDLGVMDEDERRYAKELCNVEYMMLKGYGDMLESHGFSSRIIRDVTHEVMDPLDAKFRDAVRDERAALIAMADEETLAGFATLGSQLARTAGYILVEAIRI